MDPQVSAGSLDRSCYAVSVFDGSELVGMGRVVGDLGLCFYIQDVVVLKTYQGLGVGEAIMRRIMEFVADHAVEHTYVGLMSAVGKEGFYHRYGFTSRPTATLGCGMTLFWRAEPRGASRAQGSEGHRA